MQRKNSRMIHIDFLPVLVSILYLGLSNACSINSGYSTLQSYRPKHFRVKECGQRPLYQDSTRFRRVVNGNEAVLGQWPWHVNIQFERLPPCSGVLIDSDWVLTAAHCFYSREARRIQEAGNITVTAATLKSGTSDEPQLDSENRRKVRKIYMHPGYAAESSIVNYDFMMLKLDEPFTIGPTIQTACVQIAADVVQPGASCYVAGWGKYYRTGRERMVSPELKYSDVPLLPMSECRRYAANVSRQQLFMVTEQKLCAGVWTMDWYGPCKGDSGGPLICFENNSKSWYVVGVVSHGPKCGEIGFYTNITSMLDYIQGVLNGTEPSADTDFECSDVNQTIVLERRCDGVADCDDLSDETDCECTQRQFRCPNGICRMQTDLCNSHDDCGDGTDEENCQYFQCESSGVNISSELVCDGSKDCADWSDENADSCECDPASQFRCTEGPCIPLTWRCDGEVDCPGSFADEKNCECPDDYIVCNNGLCVHKNAACNNVDECGDATDEQQCNKKCKPNEMFCSGMGSICIPEDFIVCDEEIFTYMCSDDVYNASDFAKQCFV